MIADRVESRPKLAADGQLRRSAIRRFLSDLDRVSLAALIVLALFVSIAVVGPLLPIGDPRTINTGPRLAAPSLTLPFGTDTLGRSLLPRVVQGMRNTFLLAATAVAITTVAAIFFGLAAAYFRGWLELVIVRVMDVLFSFPAILAAILLAAIEGPGTLPAVSTIVLVTLPRMVRVVRASALIAAGRDYVIAAEVAGASPARIMFVHLLPNVLGSVVVQAAFAMSIAMLVESGLSFLGLGVQPPDASLGSLVSAGSEYLQIAPWLVFAPGVVLALAILSVNLLADGLRDVLDPRLSRELA